MKRKDLSGARRIVLKIGSAVLTNAEDNTLDRGVFCRLIEMVARLRRDGRQVIIVTSGAVTLGRSLRGVPRPDRVKSLPTLQALAAIGQSMLMEQYESEFRYYGLHCAQILLTKADLEDRTRFNNTKRAIRALLEMDVIPVINENDAVTCNQLRFGDNDTLAARIAVLSRSDLLILLSDIDALYTGNPKTDPEVQRIESIEALDPKLDKFAGDSTNGVGTGGMITKIAAARMAAKMGIATCILMGKRPKFVLRLLEGDDVGSLLYPTEHKQTMHKVWLESLTVKGKIICDNGAVDAITKHGKSLLPRGILAVDGHFNEGEAVELATESGKIFAKGLVLYADADIRRIAGHHSCEIDAILGFHISDDIIHRDDLVLDKKQILA